MANDYADPLEFGGLECNADPTTPVSLTGPLWSQLVKQTESSSQHYCTILIMLSSLKVNAAWLQYRTQPVDNCGTVYNKKQPCFSNLVQPLSLM